MDLYHKYLGQNMKMQEFDKQLFFPVDFIYVTIFESDRMIE